MNTPLADFLEEHIRQGISRFYMPGHKGNFPDPLLREISRYDVTEMNGADSLFEPEGVLLESEENTARLYGTRHTSFSAGGSTLGIQTMLALSCRPGDTVLAARNAHRAFINTCALLDLRPVWIRPDYNDRFGVSGEVSPQAVAEALAAHPEARAVYLTSPDYLGCISDIAGLSAVCRQASVRLLVDNAHGAHLRFLPEDLHPITLGADLCCDSAHKTLPVFTGGGYLHVHPDCPVSKEEVKSRMGLFGSTSPSYLILLSLDLNNRYLAGPARADFAGLVREMEGLYQLAGQKGFAPLSSRTDPTKMTLDAYAAGWRGEELAAWFRERKLECEYAAERHVVFMLSPQNTEEDLERFRQALKELPQKPPLEAEAGRFSIPEAVLPVREAAFAPKERVPVEKALGRIAGETRIKCPPGVPILVAGEKIDHTLQKLLKKSSISSLDVLK